jgi:ferric-dicitrate binding protein FerR (iron transport regulator)
MSEDKTSRYEELAEKWINGTITPTEAVEYAQWYNSGQDLPVEIPISFAANEQEQRNRMLYRILDGKKQARILPLYSRILWWAAAAVFILICSAGGLLFIHQQKQKTATVKTPVKDIAPGHNGAVLTLSNGATVVLDSASNGTLAQEHGVQVIKQNGQLLYQSGNRKFNTTTFNTLTTPRGRQFQLVLPDGSRVWLNAASSITYPTAFVGNTRNVTITGEAYFEIAHISAAGEGSSCPFRKGQAGGSIQKGGRIPFIVKANGTEVTVLGTHFDVMAYADENFLNTTLLEGSVKVRNRGEERIIKPGQQVRINPEGQLQVQEVNTDEAVAWINGKLSLENINVETLMKQISRWYDVDIEYRGAIPRERFGGIINRNVNLSDLLSILASNGVSCALEGKKIIVSVK